MTEVAEEGVRLTPAQLKRRRARSVAIALALFAIVVVFYVVTIAKIGGNIAAGTGG
jgi:cell division septal protein FtsQ